MACTELIFSPTGGTKRVADLLCEALGGVSQIVDLSRPDADVSHTEFVPQTLCVVAVPVFAGRIPAVAAARLRALRGNGARAVAVVVYGNRAYEDALLELGDLLTDRGFCCMAGIAAIAEHSMIRSVAAGRPDPADAAQLQGFARSIQEACTKDFARAPAFPGNRPYRALKAFSTIPQAGDTCTHCGLCASQCPTGAIPRDHPNVTHAESCMACMRCVSLCPARARAVPEDLLAPLRLRLEQNCMQPRPNELFL